MATMANEGEGGGPITEESQGMVELSPVMSYEKGTDHIEPVTIGGEIKYAVSGSQGTQPQETDAVEGKDPEDETHTGEQAGKELRQSESGEDIEDGGVGLDDEDPYRYNVKEGKKPVRGPGFKENYQPKSILEKTVGTSEYEANTRVVHDCGCVDLYDHTGKKRQLACKLHRSNPLGSVRSLSPKTRKVTNSSEVTQGTPVAKRIDKSRPPPPPLVIPTKGRIFVKASKNSPEFIDPFNCDPATEPTGPPNTLTTTPTEEATEEATEEVAEEEKIPKVNIDVKIPTAEAGQSDERVNASERNNAAADASDSVRKDQDGVPESPLVLHSPVTVRTNNNGEPSCNAGPLIFKTNSNGEHVLLPLPDFPPTHTASEATRDGEHDDSRRKRRTCAPRCVLM